MAQPATRKLPRDLAGYWRMEAMNIFFVPGIALYFSTPRNRLEAFAFMSAALATAAFLLVGTLYWRGVERRARLGDRGAKTRAIRLADRFERPTLLMAVIAVLLTGWAWSTNGWSPAVIASTALLALTWLEYVNYYHWQLQIFDHAADWRRTIATRRLKRAHMARELERFRQLPREGVSNQNRVVSLRRG
ncbi:MAG: hypothetical protein ABIW83_04810 [Allosphingosinicella sp.]